MICCSNCFIDKELQQIVKTISTNIGNCDYCCSKSVKVVDIRELAETFSPVIDLYEEYKSSSAIIADAIQSDWNLFKVETSIASRLISDMFSDSGKFKKSLFYSQVRRKEYGSSSSDLLTQWNLLKEEIKYRNRFFIQQTVDLETMDELFIDQSIVYNKDYSFYRARISTEKGYAKSKMGKPPAENASAGRANPYGIPYLYVSTDKTTTLYEARSSYLDFVSIAEFRLKVNLNVVQLKSVKDKSPFLFTDLKKYSEYQPFLVELEKDLSKPLRRFDSELDYLPTQYLCEYIKSLGYDGIEFGSAMNKVGTNLAVFDDNKLKCMNCEVVEIKNIEITY